MKGEIYTETVIHSAPEAFVSEVPYQLVIVTLENARRVTGRVLDGRVSIGDVVTLVEERNGVPFFKR